MQEISLKRKKKSGDNGSLLCCGLLGNALVVCFETRCVVLCRAVTRAELSLHLCIQMDDFYGKSLGHDCHVKIVDDFLAHNKDCRKMYRACREGKTACKKVPRVCVFRAISAVCCVQLS